MSAKKESINSLIETIKAAIQNPNQPPAPIVLSIFQNDLVETICQANENGWTMEHLIDAIKYVHCRVTGHEKKAVLKKWGRK